MKTRNIYQTDYLLGGLMLPNRHESTNEYRYGFISMEKDNKVSSEGNSYDFGVRMYNSRIGRWMSKDPHETKYHELSPNLFVANMPIVAVDPDGKDIIILSAPSRSNGFEHALVLICNDESGKKLYSKKGTEDHGVLRPSFKPDDGREFNSLTDFTNSEANFGIKGNVLYTSAFKITTSVYVDNDKVFKSIQNQ